MTSSRSGRPTLATIAQAAGVSVATVSKVLNDRDDVAPATRAMVQELLQRHYYTGRTVSRHPSIELIFHSPLNAYCTEVMEGVVEAGESAGVGVVVKIRNDPTAGGAVANPEGWALDLAAAGRQAVITVTHEMPAPAIAALERAGLPMVVIDPLGLPSDAVTSVGSTNYAGGVAATRHLLGLGHRRIAYLGGPAASGCNQARLHAFRGETAAAGVSVPDEYVTYGDFSFQHGLTTGAALMDLPEPPTAIFTGCDEIAIGVLEAARARKIRVPEDLSVIGFDDTQVATLSSPQLTTVRQPLREMGRVAMRTALAVAAGDRVDSHHVELATALVVRDSTAALD